MILKIYTTLSNIVSQIRLNLGHVFQTHTADDAKAKHVSQIQEDLWNNITKSCVNLQFSLFVNFISQVSSKL